MAKKIYEVWQKGKFDDELYYVENESLEEALFEHIKEHYDLNRNRIYMRDISVKKLDIKHRNDKKKDMKNRTVLK